MRNFWTNSNNEQKPNTSFMTHSNIWTKTTELKSQQLIKEQKQENQ